MDSKDRGFPRPDGYPEGDIFDVAILGAGPSGLTSAVYTGRAMLKTVLVEKLGAGGQAALSDNIENYPGFPEGIVGYDLTVKMEEQAKKFGTQFEYGNVVSLSRDSGTKLFEVKTEDAVFHAKTVIVSTGVSPKHLGVPGEENLIGKGISFCATCDGAFYRNKVTAVVGGGDAAVGEAVFLTKFASRVYIVHRRDELRAAKTVQDRAFANPKIEIVWDSVVESVKGADKVEGLVLKNVKTGAISELAVDGIFLFVGGLPNTAFLDASLKNETGFVVTDEEMRTKTPGLFAAGDCRVKKFRQVATAVGDGAQAAWSAEKYLEENFHE